MATEFPHVDFVSLDMVPLVPHTPRANVIFEVYDVYNGLAEPDASFDMVHTRRTVSQVGGHSVAVEAPTGTSP